MSESGARPPERKSDTGNSDSGSSMKHSEAGFEFIIGLAVMTGIGYLVDYNIGSEPWGMLVGLFLGMASGTYRLVRVNQKMDDDTPSRFK